MQTTFQKCKAVGDELEAAVAKKLENAGYTVFRNCHVPYHPGRIEHVEVDIVAVNSRVILSIECKNFHGEIYGAMANRYWTHKRGEYQRRVGNFIRQSESHKDALI